MIKEQIGKDSVVFCFKFMGVLIFGCRLRFKNKFQGQFHWESLDSVQAVSELAPISIVCKMVSYFERKKRLTLPIMSETISPGCLVVNA